MKVQAMRKRERDSRVSVCGFVLAGFVFVFLFLLEISLCLCFCDWLTRKGKKMLKNLGMCSYVDL